MKTKSKILIGLLVTTLTASAGYFIGDLMPESMQANVLNTVENNEETDKIIDFSIENIELLKQSSASKTENFHKYYANVKIKNLGDDFQGKLTLESSNNSYAYNLDINLVSGKEYTIVDYPLFLDSSANEFTIDFNLIAANDINPGNNQRKKIAHEFPAKLYDLELDYDFDTKKWSLDYFFALTDYSGLHFELMTLDTSELSFRNMDYYEFSRRNILQPYKKIALSAHQLEQKWTVKAVDESFFDDFKPHDYEGKYLMIRAINDAEGHKYYSDIMEISSLQALSKHELADFVLKLVNEQADDPVEKLYEMGLIDDGEYPLYIANEPATREDALKIITNYYNVDLTNFYEFERFVDVNKKNPLYVQAQNLANQENADHLGDYLRLEEAASYDFLTYLVNAYK